MLKRWAICVGAVLLLAGGGVAYGIHKNMAELLKQPEVLAGTQALALSERETLQGRVVGFAPSAGGHAWLGIPYARAERWHAPQEAQPWTGVRNALVAGERCPQINPTDRRFGLPEEEWGRIVGSENCLSLNVHAPAMAPRFETIKDKRLPVMVFLHLGGNSVGWGTRVNFARFVADNEVVVVTVNYRLGLFGWFHHPALHGDDASALDRSGNYGTLDIIAALKWVRGSIDAFGGDPANVTLFGDSSGSKNVMSMLVSPLAEGLFHKAIMMSGLSNGIPQEVARNLTDEKPAGIADSSREVINRLLVGDGKAPDRERAKALQARMSAGEIAAYLRGKSAQQMLAAVKPDLYGKYSDSYFFTDGAVFPSSPFFEHIRNAPSFKPVPVIIGMTRDETKLFQLMQPEMLDKSAIGVKVTPKDQVFYDAAAHYRTQTLYGLPSHAFARLLAKKDGAAVYHYRFDWDEHPSNLFVKTFVLDLDKTVGASHMMDLPFLIGDFTPNSIGFPLLFVGEHDVASRDALSKQFQSYVMQFVRKGTPGKGIAGELPDWKPWSLAADAGKYLILDTPQGGGIRMASDELTKAGVIRQLDGDPRLTKPQRCSVFSRMLKDEAIFASPDAYPQLPEYGALAAACSPH